MGLVCLSPVGYGYGYPTDDKHTISTFVDQTHILLFIVCVPSQSSTIWHFVQQSRKGLSLKVGFCKGPTLKALLI